MAQGLGFAKAASIEHDFGADINRLYQREAYSQQIRGERERKAQYHAGLRKEGHANTQYASAKLRTFYDELNKKIGDFAIENPNFEQDPDKMAEYLGMTDQYLNNDILRKDLQVKQEFDKLRSQVIGEDITQAQYDREMDKYTTYINQDPNSDKPVDPYMYQNIKPFNYFDVLDEAADAVAISNVTEQRGDKLYTVGQAKPGAFLDAADIVMQDEDKALEFNKRYNNGGNALYSTVNEYVAALIKNRKQMDNVYSGMSPEWTARQKAAASKAGEKDPPDFVRSKNLFRAIASRVDQYGNGVTNVDNHSIAWTGYDEGDPTTLDRDSGVKFIDPNWAPNREKNDDGSLKEQTQMPDWDMNFPIKILNADKVRMIGGVAYVETTIQVSPPSGVDKNGAYTGTADPTLVEKLMKYNFKEGKVQQDGVMGDINFEDKTKSSIPYTGKVLMPANFDSDNMLRYEKGSSTTQASDLAKIPVNELELISQNRHIEPVASAQLKSKFGLDFKPLQEKPGGPKNYNVYEAETISRVKVDGGNPIDIPMRVGYDIDQNTTKTLYKDEELQRYALYAQDKLLKFKQSRIPGYAVARTIDESGNIIDLYYNPNAKDINEKVKTEIVK